MKVRWIQVNKIKGYEMVKDYYMICSDGRCINADRLSYLKIKISGKSRYPYYGLMMNNGKKKNINIHVLLAKAFIKNPNNLPVVRHLDDNKLNWNLSNLAWGTASDNEHDKKKNRGSYSGAAADTKPVRCIELDKIFPSTHEAQRATGINNGSINQCCTGKRKSAGGGYHWEFVQLDQE